MFGYLEVLFQEQLMALAEDAAEQQMAKKGKAVAIDNTPARPCRQPSPLTIMFPEELEATFRHQVDMIIDNGPLSPQKTTMVDMTEDIPKVIRQGAGVFE